MSVTPGLRVHSTFDTYRIVVLEIEGRQIQDLSSWYVISPVHHRRSLLCKILTVGVPFPNCKVRGFTR